MTLLELVKKFEKCKICGAINAINIHKHYDTSYGIRGLKFKKDIKRPKGIVSKCSIENYIIKIIEKGPYNTWLSEEIIDIIKNSYIISSVKDYIFDIVDFRIILECPTGDLKQKEPEEKTIAKGFKNNFEEFPLSLNHYEFVGSFSINQTLKEIINIEQLSEIIENEDYLISKDFGNKTTKITKLQKYIDLPFVYEKDFEEFDFNKLLEVKSLLK